MMQTAQWNPRETLENPFLAGEAAEALAESSGSGNGALAAWTESFTPFAEDSGGAAAESDAQRLLAEAFAELRDEAFDEALAFLAEETEQAVEERFTGETALSQAERERFADAHLSSVRFEAEQYLAHLETGLAGLDVGSFSPEQLDETLDRFDPQPGELTPAGEEFIGKLVKKAKGVVKFVARAAKTVGKVAGAVIGPVLKKLRGLVNPLLRRVLSFAIGRLPAPLQPAARQLASRIKLEAEAADSLDEEPASPANLTDVEMLAESFDAALAEAIATAPDGEAEHEAFAAEDEADVESRELERLAEARGVLIDQLRDAYEGQDLAPAIEQFVPALLGALRLGINLIGRPKVVGFLAKYLGQLIGKWVGPQLSRPLSSAIVDTGLRLISLEAEAEAESPELTETEAGPVALASVIEDTVRRLAESEDYVFENDELTQLATAEALSAAVATNFPPRFVRPALQQAPSLGGTFVARRPRKVRTYRKYSRVPEVEITPQIADALPSFGGTTVGAALRAAGARFPFKARMHIYQATVGTTLPRMVRIDRAGAGAGRTHVSSANVHPLTTAAAGLLLREPKLGADVSAQFLRSRQRIAVGQRFYLLEPIGAASTLNLPASPAARAAAARIAPSRAWTVINVRHARVTVGLYLSEADAQSIVAAIRQGKGSMTLLKALVDAYQRMDRFATSASGHVRIVREDNEEPAEAESFSAAGAQLLSAGIVAALRKKLRGWVLPALASWARANGEAFVRAAAHPDAGVTLRIRLTAVPGLAVASAGGLGAIAAAAARATPTIAITIAPGRRRA